MKNLLKQSFLVLVTLIVVGLACSAHADAMVIGLETPPALQWQVPYFGLINLNLTTSEAVMGYDAVLKQAIAGVSLPIYTDPKGFVTLQVGADAPWQTNGATVEPLIMAGHNVLKEIPGLKQFTAAELNIFGRYSTEQGKAGVGVAFSYSFTAS